MLLNKLGYDLPGDAFYVVPRDLTMGKQGFGSVKAKFTLWERIAAPGLTKKWKWSSHFLWEPVWMLTGGGKHVPVPQLGFL